MFTIEQSVLLVIDVQGKLFELMHQKEELQKKLKALISGIKILGIPILWTEQIPEKIGNTVPQIAQLLKDIHPIEKVSFSCFPNRRFKESLLALNRKQIIVCGIEAHVCVYQTVSDLMDEGFQVEVVCDAISSREEHNRDVALERMCQASAKLTTVEMILCELLRTSEHKNFKEILRLIK